jgi:hypothetical protein
MPARRRTRDSPLRRFIKERLGRGDSARTVRLTVEHLVAQPKTFFATAEWRRWKALRGERPPSPADIHRVQSALGRKMREERKIVRAEFRGRTEADRNEALILGLEEPRVDFQAAHDAGILYRATHDEHYREVFTEGSP